MNRPLAVLLLIFCLALPTAAAPDEPQRWAIISTKAVDDGVADLLTVALAKSGVMLVERDESRRILDELALESLAGATAVAGRRQLGERLTADVLLIMEELPATHIDLADREDSSNASAAATPTDPARRVNNAERLLRVVFCHSSSGARLHVGVILLGQQPQDAVAAQIAELADRVRRQMADGIRYVVGVSPFLSKDLTHDFDAYQARLAHLLESCFYTMPGVAVIEREEAQTIWNELADKPDTSLSRVVPVLMDGAYTSQRAAGEVEPRLTIEVTSRQPDGEAKRHQSTSLAPSELGKWLSTLPNQLFAAAGDGEAPPEFEPLEQFDWLIARARLFSQIGEWKHAIDLRQAAILLKPNDVGERLALIGNERLLLGSIAQGKERSPTWLPSAGKARAAVLVSIYLDQLANVEFLIRNSLIDKQIASDLILPRIRAEFETGVTAKEAAGDREVQAVLTNAEKQRRDHLWSISPHLFSLADRPPTRANPNPTRVVAELQHGLLWSFGRRVDHLPLTDDDFSYLIRLWTERIPDDLGLPTAILRIRTMYFPDSERVDKRLFVTHGSQGERPGLSRDVWGKFVDQLAQSKHRSARVTGRIEQLVWRWYLVDKNTPTSQLAPLAAMAESAVADFEQYLDRGDDSSTTTARIGRYAACLDSMRWQIDRLALVPNPFAERRRLPALVAKVSSPKPRTAPNPQQSGRVTFELLPVQFPVHYTHSFPLPRALVQEYESSSRVNHSEKYIHGRARWRAWGNDIDVVWTPLEIWWMREPGKFEKLELPESSGVLFDDVQPDGDRLWVTTLDSGITIVGRDGRVIHRISSEQGLPPANHGLVIHPLGGGKACASGAFGKNCRSWCAIIDVGGETPSVSVFHEARRVPDESGISTRFAADSRGAKPPFLEAAFIPHCIVPHTNVDGRKQLYISRTPPNLQAHPDALVVNLDDLSVSEGRMPGNYTGSPYGYDREDQYVTYGDTLTLLSPLAWIQLAGQSNLAMSPAFASGASAVRIGDEIHLPSQRNWLRLNLKTNVIENLALGPEGIPTMQVPAMVFAESAHYGIIGLEPTIFPRRAVMRVEIGPPVEPAVGQAAVAPLPPSPMRVDTSRRFPLAEGDRVKLIELAKQCITDQRILPAHARIAYADNTGYKLHDWLPRFDVGPAWIDPPTQKRGGKFYFVDGKLMRMEVLGNPDASTDVWYDEQDRPIFVSGASRHWFGQYDDRGLLAKVIAMNADFRVTRITAYEHADRYQAAVIYYCEGDGTCQRVALNSALDAQGQPLEFEKSATAAYSKRFESITEPMRYGLLPYYPIPGGQ